MVAAISAAAIFYNMVILPFEGFLLTGPRRSWARLCMSASEPALKSGSGGRSGS
jgi:hypothetical protein